MAAISKNAGWEIIRKLLYPLVLFLLFIASYVHYKVNIAPIIPAQLHQELKKYIGTVLIICIAFIIQRIVDGFLSWYKGNVVAKTATELDDKLVPLLRRSAKVAIWVIALLVTLPLYGVNITALIAALGVSSLAIALAAQDTIANIIAGYLIMIDVPFRVGDAIKIPTGENVQVLEIGVRRSKFLSEDKAVIIVPNVNLSKSKIVNYTYGKERGEALK